MFKRSHLPAATSPFVTRYVVKEVYPGIKMGLFGSRPFGERLVSATVGGRPIEDDEEYSVTTLEFVAKWDKPGKGVSKTIRRKLPMLMRDMLVREVEENSPIYAKIDGRASDVNGGCPGTEAP